MYIITGAKGLIGGALMRRLKDAGYKNILPVDITNEPGFLHMRDLFRYLQENYNDVKFIFHLGANTNTLETSRDVFDEFNLGYSKSIWYRCARHKIPIVYASSAATYGIGNSGFSDTTHPDRLQPLNEYGLSKNEFDRFIFSHVHINDAPFWAGVKFFNVYGFDESHKGKMASMVFHTFNQIIETKTVRLFKYGEHTRDFIYVEDVVTALIWLMKNRPESGLYNIGTGVPRNFNDLVNAVFTSMGADGIIKYIDMPEIMLGKYQAFTHADISKLRAAGFNHEFHSLESGIDKYIKKLSQWHKENTFQRLVS